jgi:hypothetical protein
LQEKARQFGNECSRFEILRAGETDAKQTEVLDVSHIAARFGAAAASKTWANGNNPLTFNFAQTTNNQSALTVGETTAATGTGDIQLNVQTLSTSTAQRLSPGVTHWCIGTTVV